MSIAARIFCIALFGTSALIATGCTHVAPYERGVLAHPTMSMSDMTTVGEEHVHAIHEGAMGGGLSAGGGCGCN